MELDKFKQGTNPFDSIRKVGSDGEEKWSGRDLLLGQLNYRRWTDAKTAVHRAVTAMTNMGVSAGQHVKEEVLSYDDPSTFGGKRKVEDVELSRFACYMIAMNGDPSKPEIAAAQSYFAVMTQVAETVQRKLPGTFAEALRELADTTEELDNAKAENLALEAQNASLAPKARAHEEWQTAQGAYPMDTAAHMLGTGRNRLHKKLRELKVLKKLTSEPFGTEIHNGHVPYQQFIDRGYFFTVASRFYDRTTGLTKVSHKVHITPKGLEWLKVRLNESHPKELQIKLYIRESGL